MERYYTKSFLPSQFNFYRLVFQLATSLDMLGLTLALDNKESVAISLFEPLVVDLLVRTFSHFYLAFVISYQ
jgi:hypothetical protein